MSIFDATRYSWYSYNGRAKVFEGRRWQVAFIKGLLFGVRPATSEPGMWRFITAEGGPTKVHSITLQQMSTILNNSVAVRMPKGVDRK